MSLIAMTDVAIGPTSFKTALAVFTAVLASWIAFCASAAVVLHFVTSAETSFQYFEVPSDSCR